MSTSKLFGFPDYWTQETEQNGDLSRVTVKRNGQAIYGTDWLPGRRAISKLHSVLPEIRRYAASRGDDVR